MISKKFWFIAKPHKTKEYYIAGIDPKKKAFIWTHKRSDAIKFETLTATHNYIEKYLHGRTDVYVVATSSLK